MMDSELSHRKIRASDLSAASAQGWLATRGEDFRFALLQRAMVRQFETDQTLYHYGDAADGLYFVVSGSVKVSVPADDGLEFTAHRDGAGFWIGDLAMMSDQTRLISVIATEPTRTLYVPAIKMAELVEETPLFYRDFYVLEHENMRTALRILANLGVSRADQRLALRLLHLGERLGRDDGWIDVSQDALATMTVASVPTVQRVLRKLSGAGLVELGYGRVRIVNRAALLEFCQN